MRKFVTVVLGLLLSIAQLNAQNRTVSGKVTDDKGNPISNANVQAKGTQIGTTTNVDGNYQLSVPSSVKVLVISSLNFGSKEVAIAANNTASTFLNASADLLDEVIVVGYGTAKKKTDVAGSLVTVNAERLQNKPTANVFDALQGKVAGLQIYNSSGEPSATPSVRLNGIGSLGASSTPLYVMDGIPIDPGTVVSLNPEDFESMTVLRDASSTSIYGARAANGVILITTKKGKVSKSVINVQTQYGVSSLTKNTTDLFNNFMNTKEFTNFQVAFGQRTQAQVDATLATYNADTKWYQVYFKDNIPTFQTDINISGGGGKTTYYLSGSYFDQEGLRYRSGYKRYTLRSNVTTTVNNWFQMGMNLFGGYDERQTNQYSTNSLNGGLSVLAQPFYSPTDKNGVRYPNLIPGWNNYHPEYLAQALPGVSNNLQFNPSGFVQITPFKGATLRSQAGLEFYDLRGSAYRLPSFVGSLNNGNTSESFTRGSTKTITNTFEYKFRIADLHSLTFLAGQEYIKNVTTAFSAASAGQTDDRLTLLSAGPNSITASSSKSEYGFISYFGRMNYNYNSRYFIDLSVRNDNSSRFGRDLRGATFYSVGAMWKAKKEKFLENVNWLTDLTVKGSIGTSGNSSIGDYSSLATVGSSVSSGYNSNTGWFISAPGNPLLSWEKQRQANIGIQATLFKKLNLELEYFDRVTSSMLISVPYPFTSGFSSITTNVGSLKNTGINATISYDVISKKNAFLTVFGNVGYVQNKVTELFQGKQYWIIPNTGVSWAVGQPVSYFYPIYKGVNPSTGLPEWYKPNPNPDLIVNTRKDDKDVTSAFSSTGLQQSTGINRYAPWNGGFGLSAGWKAFSVSADFSFSKGKYMINNDRYFFENPNVFAGYNQSKTVLNYWKQPGDITAFPKSTVQFTQFDTNLLEDASFLRLKNLTFAYTMPREVLAKSNVFSGLKFFVTFRNLLTFTKYTGPDPEIDTNVTTGANPNTRQSSVGLNLSF